MELHALQQKLANQLKQNQKIRIVHEASFCLPVHTLQVDYFPVQRTAMDILMKMMLLSFQKAKLSDAGLLADILLVEPLFIHDLTNKMVKTGLLSKSEDEVYELTAKGTQQLAEGIFDEQLDMQTRILQYSTIHRRFLDGDLEEVLDFDEFPELSKHLEQEELGDVPHQIIVDELMALQDDPDEDDDTQQTFITSLEKIEELQINDIPYFQFVCHEEEADRYFARVYNTLTNAWDEIVEQFINDQERTSWREKYA